MAKPEPANTRAITAVKFMAEVERKLLLLSGAESLFLYPVL